MAFLKSTKDKRSNDISFIFYENEKVPRYRRIDKYSFSFLTYGPALLTLLSIVVATSAIYYANTIERQIRSSEPEIIQELRNQNISLASRADELNIINDKLTKKLSSAAPEDSVTGNLFAPVPGQKDLTSPVSIDVQDFSASKKDGKILVKFNVINLTEENKKIAGYAHMIATDGNVFERYPKIESESSLQIIYSTGESFATSRFRPFSASFTSINNSDVFFNLIIFNRLGDIIYKKIFKQSL